MKRFVKYIIAMTFMLSLTGCGQVTKSEKKFLTLDFIPNQTLRYRFRTHRLTEIDWGVENKKSKARGCCGKKKDHDRGRKMPEEMKLTVYYKPIDINPYGLSTIEAKCESVRARRRGKPEEGFNEKDAINTLKNKSFTFKVGPTGKIEDHSQLEQLIMTLGKKAFRKSTKRGKVKEPDMISDFFATQWFLWDAVSSIPPSSDGVEVGQSWKSILSVPTPMLMWEARDVNYTLSEIKRTATDEFAVIRSTYTLSDSVPESWPFPYEGKFRISGTFGFLINFELVELKGEGEEIFNITKGRTERYKQVLHLKINCGLRFPIGTTSPVIKIKQTTTMRRY